MQGLKTRQGRGLDHKDQNKGKDLTHKDKDKDLTPKDQDKDKVLKYGLKESLRTRARTNITAGDLNVHLEDPHPSDTMDFRNILDQYGLT